MGRIVIVNFVSLDGVIQSPLSADEDRDGGFRHGGWVPPYSDDTVGEFMRTSTVSATGLLLGRRTYEIFAAAWADADPSEPAVAAMNRVPKYVVSSGSVDLSLWSNSQLVDSPLPRGVIDLKERTDGDLVVFGAGTLIRGLARHDLIDEYRLLLFPLVLGTGKRMFGEHGRPARFTLSDTTVASRGVVLLTYVRTR